MSTLNWQPCYESKTLTLELLSWIIKLSYCIENQHIWVSDSVQEEFVHSVK